MDETTPAAVVIVPDNSTPPAAPDALTESIAEAREEIARISGEVETLQTTINSGIEGNREWMTQQVATLQQQLTDLTANFQTVAAGMPQQLSELREELTRLSQSVQKASSEEPPAVQIVDPALVNVEGTPEIAPANDAPPKEESKSPTHQKKKNRVI